MAKKKRYSLTAKERKALRSGKAEEVVGIELEDSVHEADSVEGAQAAASSGKLGTGRIIIIATSLFMAVVLIVFAILIPLVIMPYVNYGHLDNPVAVIKLSTGDSIELEIYEKDVPIAATNFLYLAKKKFFDNTIIFDVTNKYIRFGQYEDYATYRSKNVDFLNKITDITAPDKSSKFGYRLREDTTTFASTIRNHASTEGYISAIYKMSGTEFQICGETNAQISVNSKENDGSVQEMTGAPFGKALNKESMDIITQFQEVANFELDVQNGQTYWVGTNPRIKIVSVKLYNMDKEKWKNFNWDEFFTTAYNGASAISQWTNT